MSNLLSVSIDQAIFTTSEHLCLTGVVVEGIDTDHVAVNAGRLLADASQQASKDYAGIDDLAAAAPIAHWREAYRREGLKPSRFRSSIESLIRRAVRGDSISVLPLVDLYNAISLQFRVPVGAVDLARLPTGNVQFRRARPGVDRFTPLGGDEKDFPLSTNLPVYASGDEVLCWGFNCRDSLVTALTERSRSVLFLTEALHLYERKIGLQAIETLVAMLGDNVGRVSIGIVDRGQPEWKLGTNTVSTASGSMSG